MVPLVLSTTCIIRKSPHSSLKALGFNFELDNLCACIHHVVWYPNEWRNFYQRCDVTNNQTVHRISDYRPVRVSYSDCGNRAFSQSNVLSTSEQFVTYSRCADSGHLQFKRMPRRPDPYRRSV